MGARTLLSRSKSLLIGRRSEIESLVTQLSQARATIANQNENLEQARANVSNKNEQLEKVRRRVARKDQQLARLRENLTKRAAEARTGGPRPENIIWIFGTARTGSTWLSALMGDLPEHEEWREPNVGNLFGTHYYRRLESRETNRRGDKGPTSHWKEFYVLGPDEARKNSIRAFLIEWVATMFPERTTAGYVVVKEPHGSMGAPLIMEALPESRMIFLIRDPRDVTASALSGRKKGSWIYNRHQAARGGTETLGDVPPDKFVRQRATTYLDDVQKSKLAYEAHKGPKLLVRYEELRADTVGTLRRIYATLDISMSDEELARTVEKHAFENLPEDKKGPTKFRRKATPGGWRDDLTPEQAKTIEEITAPLFREYYGGEASEPAKAP